MAKSPPNYHSAIWHRSVSHRDAPSTADSNARAAPVARVNPFDHRAPTARMSGPPNGGSRGFKRGGRGSGGNVKTDAPSASPAPKPRAPRAGGGSPAPKPRAQSVHHFAASREVTPPAQLADWLSTPEGRDAVVSAAIGVGDVVFGATTIVLHGEYPEEVDRAALLVEAVFDHRVRLHSRLAVKDRLDAERAKIQAELDAGLRVEFSVQPHLMGMIVGVQGVRIKSVSDQCDIDRVVVDRDLHVIRIVGKYPAEVRKARQMLELRVETVEARDDRTRRILIGKGGVTINDVQRRSGAMSIDVDHERGVVKILGTASAAAAAKVLMEMHIATLNDLDAAADDLEELRGEMQRLDTAWGEESHYTSVGGAHHGGRGWGRFGGGRGSPFGGRGGRGRGGGGASSPAPKPRTTASNPPKPKPADGGKTPKAEAKEEAKAKPAEAKAKPAEAKAPVASPVPAPKTIPTPLGSAGKKKAPPAPATAAATNAQAPAGALEQRPPRTRRRGGKGGGRGANVVADGGSGVAA